MKTEAVIGRHLLREEEDAKYAAKVKSNQGQTANARHAMCFYAAMTGKTVLLPIMKPNFELCYCGYFQTFSII